MNMVSAQDIKRRGMVVIEEALQQGPVRILKYNRPAAVVLSENDYQHLLAGQQTRSHSVQEWLAAYTPTGGRSRADIDRELAQERADWPDA
ncbi:MAG: type II toxin-antitoxin system Phd/YefM family antitoxin [Pseudomonadota bacterium]